MQLLLLHKHKENFNSPAEYLNFHHCKLPKGKEGMYHSICITNTCNKYTKHKQQIETLSEKN